MSSEVTGKDAPADEIASLLNQVREQFAEIKKVSDAIRTLAESSAESHQQVVTAHADIQSKLSDISAKSAAAEAQITSNQAVIATRSAHIEEAQKHADEVRAALDRKTVEIEQKAGEADGLKSRTQSSAEQASAALAETRTARDSSQADAEACKVAKTAATEAAEASKALVEIANAAEARVAEYEKRLAELGNESKERLGQILDLLPGATTAGLAHAFDDRRKTFLKPHGRWQWIFITALVLIIGIAVTGFYQVQNLQTPPTLEEIARLWLTRLPIAGALIWLAIYSSREAALAKRLEEDYGYKSVVAASYLGFQKQMAEIGASVSPGSPLAKLCEVTLTEISMPPGRIYDKHPPVASPAVELVRAAKNELDGNAKPKTKS